MKELIKENTGSNLRYVAYPYGEYSENTVKALQELGYEASVTTVDDTNLIYTGMYNLYNLNRINVYQNTTMESIRHLLEKEWQ